MAKKNTESAIPRWKRLKTAVIEKWRAFIALFPLVGKTVIWSTRIFIVIFLLDTGYLIGIWPEWKWYVDGPIPQSQFIQQYQRDSWQDRSRPRLRWKTVKWEDIPDNLVRAVLTAEDSHFYRHDGIDTEAFKKAMEYNWSQKRFVYGASTISQQTAKNLFLSPSRNPFRKWHELVLTFAMEQNLKKSRILTLYLNVAEFGQGVYGIEAAAQKYWGVRAKDLTKTQAIELAATLPAPRKHNPRTRSAFFLKQTVKIKKNMG
ncbi:MAG: monofunctional biosynthetic peptidoglycan transglycosylase [Gammaproteobacteria bacterium]|nr:monofunctional biosynthetic peptidoglycan transglycosylase [Gammaproteobacteria bacterium]